MKPKLQSIEARSAALSEDTWKAFAARKGWLETILENGATERTPNPQSCTDYLIETYFTPMWDDVAEFELSQAIESRNATVQVADAELEAARATAKETARQIITVTIE